MGQECQKCKAFSVKEEFDMKNMDEDLGDESPDVEQSFLDEEDEAKNIATVFGLLQEGKMLGKEEYYDQNDPKLAATIENKEMALTEEQRGEEIILEDGSRYQGMWLMGRQMAKESYGDIIDNVIQGNGVYYYIRGPIYSGQFVNGKSDGMGKEMWPDGSIYEGQFRNGKKQGQGVYKWSQGCMYEGEWLENMIHGYGRYEWSDGRCYQGIGIGIRCMGEASIRGPMENTTMGKVWVWFFVWADGKQYQGYWFDGKQHGKGVMINKDGKKKFGEWVNGKLISCSDETNVQIIPEGWNNKA